MRSVSIESEKETHDAKPYRKRDNKRPETGELTRRRGIHGTKSSIDSAKSRTELVELCDTNSIL
jgi:hypothetical protein